MKTYGSLQELLSAARRRALVQFLTREILFAAAVALGVAAIVLLAGSERIGMYWVPVSGLVALVIRLILKSREQPSPYAIAQWIDERLKLSDTLSTAAYFSNSDASRRVDPALRDLQRGRAEEVAKSVNVKQALPMRRPAALYPAAILAMVVAGIFLLRFSATGSFDTRASLVEGPLQALLQPLEKQARAEKKAGPGEEPGNGDQTSKELDKNRDYAGEPEAQQQAEAETPETPEAQKAEQQKGEGKGEPNASEAQTPQNPPNADNAAEQGKEQNGQQQESLLDKLKDAVSDMMNKVKPSSGKQQKSSQNGKKSEKQQGDSQEKSSDMDDKNPGDNADSENHNKGNEMDASGLSAEGEKDDNEHSGVGSQEGDKSARQAEALKAMGKLTELFGETRRKCHRRRHD